jgi:hypothetical protein
VRWQKRVLGKQGVGHGVGAGDIDGDGRPEIIGPRGYFSPPPRGAPPEAPWTFHGELVLGPAGISILAFDVDGDKLNDVVWGAPHGYGFFWMKQGKGDGGAPTWTRHEIDKSLAQLHTLHHVDLDGDGHKEVLTGKRIYGHEIEPGAEDPSFIYTFAYDRKAKAWKRDVIYEGLPPPSPPPREAKDRDAQRDFARGTAGTGLHIEVVDIDKDGDLDLVCPGKSGLYLFENLRKRPRARR